MVAKELCQTQEACKFDAPYLPSVGSCAPDIVNAKVYTRPVCQVNRDELSHSQISQLQIGPLEHLERKRNQSCCSS